MEPNQQENPETAESSQASPETAADASEEKKTEQTEAPASQEAAAPNLPAEDEAEEAETRSMDDDGKEEEEEEEEKPLARADRSLMYFFWPLVVLILYVPAGLIWLCFRFMYYKSQLLLLTNKRLVLFKGAFKKKQYMIPLDMAAQMTMEQGFLGRKAGYGTLVIGKGKEAIRYDYVRDPEKFIKKCKEAVN
jgi:hypothetical protein